MSNLFVLHDQVMTHILMMKKMKMRMEKMVERRRERMVERTGEKMVERTGEKMAEEKMGKKKLLSAHLAHTPHLETATPPWTRVTTAHRQATAAIKERRATKAGWGRKA